MKGRAYDDVCGCVAVLRRPVSWSPLCSTTSSWWPCTGCWSRASYCTPRLYKSTTAAPPGSPATTPSRGVSTILQTGQLKGPDGGFGIGEVQTGQLQGPDGGFGIGEVQTGQLQGPDGGFGIGEVQTGQFQGPDGGFGIGEVQTGQFQGHVGIAGKVEMKFLLEHDLLFSCAQFMLRQMHRTNSSVSAEAKY